MKFKNLHVYIQPHSNINCLKARVVQGHTGVCARYGSNLLKNDNVNTITEAMELCARYLVGTTEKIIFSFPPALCRETITYEYPGRALTVLGSRPGVAI